LRAVNNVREGKLAEMWRISTARKDALTELAATLGYKPEENPSYHRLPALQSPIIWVKKSKAKKS